MKFLPLLILFFGFSLLAQESPNPDSLKIGVVLSGGGAKGLAHIGALQEIEKAGVHIDYIGGSSMGAVVGGLYAAGYSADQLDSIFRKTNFRTLIQDDLPRHVKTFYEKAGSERYALTLPFDDFKLQFPSGLSQGQNVYNLLSQLMYPVRGIDDFSKLPVPFFSIGTDIETGERLVLDQGSLPLTTSASSAIPSLFSPVKIGDRLVSDGGITDNFPVEEMQKHDIDYIIGVDVQDSLVDRGNLKSVFQILTQVNNFRTIKAMESKRKKVDLYINPDIKDFSIISFDKGKDIIKAGLEGARKKKNKLDSLGTLQQRPVKPKRVTLRDSVAIKNIDIKGNTTYPRDYIRGKLKINTNEKTSYKKLNEGLNNLSATDNFERVNYKLLPHDDEWDDLVLKINDNPNKTSFRASLHYDKLYKGAALLNVTHKSLLFHNDISSFDLIAGDNLRYNLDYFIDKGSYWSIGVKSSLNQFEKNVGPSFIEDQLPDEVSDVNKIQLDYLDLTNKLYVETFFLNALRFGVGFEHKYTRLKTETVLKQEDEGNVPFTLLERSHLFGPFGYLEYDGYDNAYFPGRGFHFRGDADVFLFKAHSTFGSERFTILKGELGYAFTPFPRFSLRAEAKTGVRIGNSDMKALDFFLGGYGNRYVNNIEPLLGYDYLSESGDSFIKARAEVDYELFEKNHLIGGYNMANARDNLYDEGKIFDSPDYTGIFVGYGIQSILGPLEVYYSHSPETGKNEWFFSLGFWF